MSHPARAVHSRLDSHACQLQLALRQFGDRRRARQLELDHPRVVRTHPHAGGQRSIHNVHQHLRWGAVLTGSGRLLCRQRGNEEREDHGCSRKGTHAAQGR